VIELAMVNRMLRRAALLAPFVALGLALFGDARLALSGLVGLALAGANLWLAARIIGGVAESNPQLLVGAGMVAFGLGLALLTALALGLQALRLVSFPVTGFTLIASHLVLVLWEAARTGPTEPASRPTTPMRS
jgi:hypothetical protein